MRYFLLVSAILSILLASNGLFAQEQVFHREDLFNVGFRQLPFFLSFTFESEDFQKILSSEEKKLFDELISITELIKTADFYQRSYDETGVLGEYGREILEQDRPALHFSNKRENFRINQTEPERLAKTSYKMDEPISVNLQYLNSHNIDPTYLEVVQLLIHELGHKIAPVKNQSAMDSLGSKIINFIKPYYQSARNGATRVEVISLPMVDSRLQFSLQDSVRLLVNHNGIVKYDVIYMDSFMPLGKRFTPGPDGSGNIMEQTSLRLTNLKLNLENSRTDLSFNVETLSKLVVVQPNVQLVPGNLIIGNKQQMIPVRDEINLIKPSVSNQQGQLLMEYPKLRGRSGFLKVARIDGTWNFKDESLKFKILNVSVMQNEVRIKVSNQGQIRNVKLRLSSRQGALLVSGKHIETVGGHSSLSFFIPQDVTSENGILNASDIIVNDRYSSSFPDTKAIAVNSNGLNATGAKIGEVKIFDGRSWINYSASSKMQLPDGPVRIRMAFSSSQKLKQVRLRWVTGASLSWNKVENLFGTYGTVHEETISKIKLVESSEASQVYEFESYVASDAILPEAVEGIIVQDSSKRVLKEFFAVTDNMIENKVVFTSHVKIFNEEFLSVKSKSNSLKCSTVFSGF